MLSGGQALKAKIKNHKKRSVYASFPFVYPSWNDIHGMHWAPRKRKHDQFQAEACAILKGLHIEPFNVPVKILIDLYFRKKRNRDNDNYGGKWLIDAIRMVGIIPDDSTEWIPRSPDILIINGAKEDQIVLEIVEE